MFPSFADVLKHPITALRFRREAVSEIMKQKGVGRFKARDILNDATDSEVAYCLQSACDEAGVSAPPALAALIQTDDAGPFGAIGDGTIIRAIVDFFKAHPEIIAAAVKALLLLVGL